VLRRRQGADARDAGRARLREREQLGRGRRKPVDPARAVEELERHGPFRPDERRRSVGLDLLEAGPQERGARVGLALDEEVEVAEAPQGPVGVRRGDLQAVEEDDRPQVRGAHPLEDDQRVRDRRTGGSLARREPVRNRSSGGPPLTSGQ
jgi:hypothetical protein